MTLKEAALRYAELGLPVLPLVPGDKIPIAGTGVYQATTNKYTIIDWWEREPNYNIGMAMGNGLIALDLDEDETGDKHGLETLKTWEAEHGKRLPDTWIHYTPRGGAHYVYRDPIGYESKEKLFHDIELKSTGNYIVVPPSIRGSDGKPYEWEAGFSPEDMDATTIDATVQEFLIGEEKETSTGFTLEEKIPDGTRHIVLMQLIGYLRGKWLSEESIRAVVEIENRNRCEPPLTDRELEREIFPALAREWDLSKPYWKINGGDDTEIWWLKRKIELMDQIIQRQQALLN